MKSFNENFKSERNWNSISLMWFRKHFYVFQSIQSISTPSTFKAPKFAGKKNPCKTAGEEIKLLLQHLPSSNSYEKNMVRRS